MANEERAIYDRLAAAPTFHPASVALFANDWGLDAGDVVAVKTGDDTFSVPIYGMTLDWRGNSMVEIQSTGNEERKPLSALKRKQFASGRGRYRQEKEIDGYYQRLIEEHGSMGLIAGALGVVLDASGNPVTDPTTGKLVYDATSPAEMFSRLLTTPNYAELVSALNNGTQQISGAKINLSSQGSVLIQAINNRPSSQSSVIIDADKIDLTGYVTATALDARLINVDQLLAQTGYAGTLYLTGSTGISANGAINASSISANSVSGQSIYLLDSNGGNLCQISSRGVIGFGTAVPSGGQISIPYYTFLTGQSSSATPGGYINFNIADTAYYQNHVGISSNTAGGWTNDGQGGGYYNLVTATPIDTTYGTAATARVTLPTITLSADSNWSATYKKNVYAKGPVVGELTEPAPVATALEIDASGVYSDGETAGKKAVTPSIAAAGWRWEGTDGADGLHNKVTATNPNDSTKKDTVTVDPPTITVGINSSQILAYASDDTNSYNVATANYTMTASNLTVTLADSGGTAIKAVTCADNNLTAANIKSGVSIFGVSGTYNNSGTITGITQRMTAVYSDDDKEYTIYLRASGTNLTNNNNQYDTTGIVDASDAYDAGAEDEAAKYTEVSVTKQGSAVSVKKQGSAVSVTAQGTATKITPIGSSSLYLASKAATAVYFKSHSSDEKPTGTWYTKVSKEQDATLAYADVGSTGTWYHTVSSGGTRYYKAGTAATYYSAGTAATYYSAGTAATYYSAGTAATYYTKSS